MSRLAAFLSLALLAAAPVTAGELDREYVAKSPTTPAIASVAPVMALPALSPADGRTAGELDAEAPTQACGWRRGFGLGFGGLGGFGYRGLGGFGFPYGGFGGFGLRYSSFGLGFGGLGYGGLGGFGFPYGGFGGYPGYGYGGWGGWGCW